MRPIAHRVDFGRSKSTDLTSSGRGRQLDTGKSLFQQCSAAAATTFPSSLLSFLTGFLFLFFFSLFFWLSSSSSSSSSLVQLVRSLVRSLALSAPRVGMLRSRLANFRIKLPIRFLSFFCRNFSFLHHSGVLFYLSLIHI